MRGPSLLFAFFFPSFFFTRCRSLPLSCYPAILSSSTSTTYSSASPLFLVHPWVVLHRLDEEPDRPLWVVDASVVPVRSMFQELSVNINVPWTFFPESAPRMLTTVRTYCNRGKQTLEQDSAQPMSSTGQRRSNVYFCRCSALPFFSLLFSHTPNPSL